MDGSKQPNGSHYSNQAAGVRRVAALLAAVSPQQADAILGKLTADQAEAIRDQMPPTKSTIQPVQVPSFDFLAQVSQSDLFVAIMRERPQTQAILLSAMPPRLAPRIMLALTPSRRTEVLQRLSQLPNVPGEVVETLLVGLKQRIEKLCTQGRSSADGVQRVASILKACDRDTESSMLSSLGQQDRELTSEIQQMLFTFNNIATLSDDQVQTLTKNVHAETWAMALKRCESNVRDRVFANLSTRAAQHVRAEMNYLGQVTPSEIDRAQQQVVNVARQLQEPSTVRRAA
ncbi:MAG: FliG C-terminal domain-containing protein [Pirellulaceae bacterium]